MNNDEEGDKDITGEYTGETIEEPTEEELDYDEEEESELDATALGVDADQIGHLTSLGMSYLICKPKEIDVNGEHYNLQQNYINSTKGEYAELARGLNIEKHLAQLNLGQLSPGQAIGIFALGATGLVMKQRREFQAELKKLKQEKGNGSQPEGGSENAE